MVALFLIVLLVIRTFHIIASFILFLIFVSIILYIALIFLIMYFIVGLLLITVFILILFGLPYYNKVFLSIYLDRPWIDLSSHLSVHT